MMPDRGCLQQRCAEPAVDTRTAAPMPTVSSWYSALQLMDRSTIQDAGWLKPARLTCLTHLVRVQQELQAGRGLSAELPAEPRGRAEGACILICQLAHDAGQHIHRQLQQACPGNQVRASSCQVYTSAAC